MCLPQAQWDDGLWKGPALLWFGKPEEAPPCPSYAAQKVAEGHRDLDAPAQCDPCTCGAPTGSCSLPTQMIGVNAPLCPGDGGGVTAKHFDAPEGWDGKCTTANALPAGNGVQSLSIAPLKMEESCAPVGEGGGKPQERQPPQARWGTYAEACFGQGYPPCDDGRFRMPMPALPDGFRGCLYHPGYTTCPAEYPDREIFFRSIDDTRTCNACACEATGGMCTARISVFNDDDCRSLQTSNVVSSEPGFCVNIMPPGVALGSKMATDMTYTPGNCKLVAGDAAGHAEPAEPMTFCCQP